MVASTLVYLLNLIYCTIIRFQVYANALALSLLLLLREKKVVIKIVCVIQFSGMCGCLVSFHVFNCVLVFLFMLFMR